MQENRFTLPTHRPFLLVHIRAVFPLTFTRRAPGLGRGRAVCRWLGQQPGTQVIPVYTELLRPRFTRDEQGGQDRSQVLGSWEDVIHAHVRGRT